MISSNPRVVIIGGGFAGLNAARELGRKHISVTLIDKKNYHLFQPLLYQIATGSLSAGEIASPLRSVLAKYSTVQTIQGNVREIDPQKKIVRTEDAAFSYDVLIVAGGMNTHFFGHADWGTFAPGLKTIEDAVEIRSRVLSAFEKAERTENADKRKHLLTFVVVGAGPTGVELAGALAELARLTLSQEFRHFSSNDVEIYLIEGGTRILPTFSDEISDYTERALNQLGVKVLTNCRVDRVDSKGVHLKLSTENRELFSDTIIWAAGVRACALGDILKSAAGAEQDSAGRVRVTEYLTLPTHNDIYVVGDLANSTDRDGKMVPGVAPAAIQQGRYVARRIIHQLQSKPSRPFRYLDKGAMAVVGRGRAVVESGRLRIFGFPAWLVWAFVHIYSLVEFENRMIVFLRWAWNYVTNKRGSRLIIDARSS